MHLDFSGKWRANLENSRLLGPSPRELLITIVHSEPELRFDMAVTSSDGNTRHIDFCAPTTGESATNLVLGAVWKSRLAWIDSELLIESWINHSGREMHFCDYWSLSSDCRVLTMEHRDDDLQGQITVLDRVDGPE